jgi:tRNA-Thr(GGU) m(6)t(6)A37 methyltransferase TsaA
MALPSLVPIGIIHTPHSSTRDMPIQPSGAKGVLGTVDIFPEYQAGLRDLDGFSHLILIYAFHAAEGYQLEVVPFLDNQSHGVFATRAPRRPNPLGFSVVRLEAVAEGRLHIANVDILDGTPLLDIKPFVPAFDVPEVTSTGWLETSSKQAVERRSDDRFEPEPR